MNKASNAPTRRTYQLSEKKYLDTRASAHALLGASVVPLYICFVQTAKLAEKHQFLPGGIFALVSLLCGVALLILGNRSLKRSQELQVAAEEERRLANDLIEWFITTYSCEQIDHQIEAITTMGDSPEILCLKRLDMMRILITREYDRTFDEEFLNQLCEDLYHMLYEHS